MKYFGCVAEHSRTRARDLLKAYRACIEKCQKITPDIYNDVVNMPAPRFYVSRARATNVVCRIAKGDKLLYMSENKRAMFFEIYQRYLIHKKTDPKQNTIKIVAKIIREPAPSFFIAAGRARAIILKEKKQWHRENMKRLLQSGQP